VIRPVTVVGALALMSTLGLGAAYASSMTLSSKMMGAASATTPVMFPVSVTASDGEGHAGRLRAGDKIQLVWSRQINEPSLCSSWSNTSSTRSISMTWVAVDGSTSDDVLQPGNATGCTGGFHAGTFDMGSAAYVTGGNMTFTGSTTSLTVGASTTTLTVTLGTSTGGSGVTASGTVGTWTPDAALTDRSGHNSGSNLATTSATVQW